MVLGGIWRSRMAAIAQHTLVFVYVPGYIILMTLRATRYELSNDNLILILISVLNWTIRTFLATLTLASRPRLHRATQHSGLRRDLGLLLLPR